jgi:hypothetical protein
LFGVLFNTFTATKTADNMKQATKGQLYSYHKQLMRLKSEGNVFAFLLESRINDFYKHYGVVIDQIIVDTQKLRDEFLTVDENKKIVFDAENKPVYQEGKTEYSFNQNWEALMQQKSIDKFTIQHYQEPTPEPVADATEA